MIRAILACDQDWGIGKNGALPWPHNPADLKWFKENTLNCTIVMGRKTWESLPIKPLPKRKNIVVSSSNIEGADISVPIEQLKKITIPMLEHTGDIWIIGGAQLIEQLLPYIDSIHLSRIEGVYDCDTFLPVESILDQFALDTVDNGELYIEHWIKK
jgi:dihydrofolate reductase